MGFEPYNPILVSLAASTVALLATSIAFGVAWIRARDRARRAEQELSRAPALGQGRFERLEQAVETIAVEVERIAEAERFQSRLLASRAGAPAEAQPAAPPRPVTPH